MGASSPSPEELQRQKEIEENNKRLAKISEQRFKVFENTLLELYKLKNNYPNTLLKEEEKCGRATYIANSSSRSFCPKCGYGVQKFIENKLIKVTRFNNKICPSYSCNSCVSDGKHINVIVKNLEVAKIVLKTDENDEKYFDVDGKRYYLYQNAHELMKIFEDFNERPYAFFQHLLLDENSRKYSEEAESLREYGYELYKYRNPSKNNSLEDALKYYRCIKCHLEYHLYEPSCFSLLRFKIIKDNEKEKEKGENNVENKEMENEKEKEKEIENQETKNE